MDFIILISAAVIAFHMGFFFFGDKEDQAENETRLFAYSAALIIDFKASMPKSNRTPRGD
jgi:hypothetical protein